MRLEFFVISLDAGMPLSVYLPHHEARTTRTRMKEKEEVKECNT